MSKLKKVPAFATEQEEREFWAAHDSSEYFDLGKAEKVVMPNLKPSTQTPAPPAQAVRGSAHHIKSTRNPR